MDWRVRVPGAVYRLAVEKAGSDKALAEMVAGWIGQWASGQTAQQLGGRARAARMTPEERSAAARRAGYARHGMPVPED